MKDILQDIIAHTSALGFIELVKITGTDTETTINAIAEDKSVILSGTFKNPHPEFIGVVGMPNLGKLKTILSFDDEYDEKAKINVIRGTRDDPNALSSIHFETGSGDFVNDYRFTAQSFIEDKVRAVTYHGSGWDIEIQPSVASILRLKKQQSANSEETKFRTMVEDDNLKVYFGDPSSRSELLQAFREARVSGLIGPKLLDEGIDLPEADLGIVLAKTSSSVPLIQRLGPTSGNKLRANC